MPTKSPAILVRVTLEASRLLQALFFASGGRWQDGSRDIKHPEAVLLFFNYTVQVPKLTFSSSEDYSTTLSYEERSIKDFIAEYLAPKPLDSTTELTYGDVLKHIAINKQVA